jgi:hypothetical protein
MAMAMSVYSFFTVSQATQGRCGRLLKHVRLQVSMLNFHNLLGMELQLKT